ncbi:MAG: flavin-containing monooxygenase [Gammaproteobacteria bacterium]
MQNSDLPAHVTVLVIGAGPGGLCAGIFLKRAGVHDVLLLEQASGVGGTWWHNRYPGAECDVQSHLYSFSFEPKPDWSRPYAGQAEIRAYIEQVAERHGMLPHCRLNTGVRALRWQPEPGVWQVELVDGRSLTARCVISALGMFNEIAVPALPGLDSFAGTLFHTARWPDDHDVTGQRVALIGSAASAVQTAPEIAPLVQQLDLYQRTPQWVIPKHDTPFTDDEIARFRADPAAVAALRAELYAALEAAILFDDPAQLADAERAGVANLSVVKDADLRRRLTPDWRYGCRRPLLSNRYFPIFNRPNVRLIDHGIARVARNGIVTRRGEFRPTDTIILATGFATTRYLSALAVSGTDGLDIRAAWRDGAVAYRGVTTAGFPNLFMLYGPNTNNNSLLTMLELEAGYAVRLIERILREDLRALDVRTEAMAAYNATLQQDIARVAVWRNDCGGYYRAESGRNVTQCPYTMTRFAELLAAPDDQAYLALR